jgi:uncharacterized protein
VIRATLDTNILAPEINRTHLPPQMWHPIVRAWYDGSFELVISEHIVGELRHTLAKPYFSHKAAPGHVDTAVEWLRRIATVVPITVAVEGVATHPEDDLVLATAVSGEVDYLVTRDRQLLRLGTYAGVRIVDSQDFLRVLQTAFDA